MTIHKIQLNDDERINYPASIFGIHFLHVESFVFTMARQLSQTYTGGLWTFYKLSNGAFYMAPDSDTPFHVTCMNGYEGTLSADSFGITVCLFAYSHLSFTDNQALADTFGEQFHLLRDLALQHCQVREIFAAID